MRPVTTASRAVPGTTRSTAATATTRSTAGRAPTPSTGDGHRHAVHHGREERHRRRVVQVLSCQFSRPQCRRRPHHRCGVLRPRQAPLPYAGQGCSRALRRGPRRDASLRGGVAHRRAELALCRWRARPDRDRRRLLVFVEVKTRSTTAFGDPLEAVGEAKAIRVRRLASRWLADNRAGRGGAGALRRGCSRPARPRWAGADAYRGCVLMAVRLHDFGPDPRRRPARHPRRTRRGGGRHLRRPAWPVLHRAGRRLGRGVP